MLKLQSLPNTWGWVAPGLSGLGQKPRQGTVPISFRGIKYLLMLLDQCGLPSWGWSSLKDLHNPQISTHLHTKFWTVVNGALHLYHQTTNEGISFSPVKFQRLQNYWRLVDFRNLALGFLRASPLPMSWTFTDCSSLPITTRSTLDNVGFRLTQFQECYIFCFQSLHLPTTFTFLEWLQYICKFQRSRLWTAKKEQLIVCSKQFDLPLIWGFSSVVSWKKIDVKNSGLKSRMNVGITKTF